VNHQVVEVTDERVRGAAQAAADGFVDNEIWVWMLGSEERCRRMLPRHYRAMIRRVYMPRRAAWTTPDTKGTALWFPPGTLNLSWRERFTELVSLLPGILPALGRAGRWEELIRKHHPREPHWYLQTLAVEPGSQRSGYGSALMQPGLDRADAEGMPCYLETQRESNIPFYERYGFELTGEVSLHDSPPLWLMWRDRTALTGD
jgi:GNAT superfamily N-acetyltransferase